MSLFVHVYMENLTIYTSLGVGCLRLHGISNICSVPSVSPTANKCCFSEKQMCNYLSIIIQRVVSS